MKKNFIKIVIIMLFLFIYAENVKATEYLEMGGAGSGGRWFMEATAITGLLTDEVDGVQASPRVVPSGGRGNMEMIHADMLALGVACCDEAYSAYNGIPPYYENNKLNIKAWFKHNPTFITIVADENIQSIEDLRGGRIGLGLPGSVENEQAQQLLSLYGMEKGEDYRAEELGREDSLNELIDGRLDAAINGLSRNNEAHQGRAMAARSSLHLVSIDKDKANEFIEIHPYFEIDEEGDPNLGQPDVRRIATPMYKIVNPKLDEDLVYELTKALWENIDRIYDECHWYKSENVTLETATEGVMIPFHPGAERYYEEQGVID